jgi:TonB-linked SusC/RagA family outer membrane protein
MKSKLLVIIFILISSIGFSQKHEISGKVMDGSSGVPLPGVNITVKNTSQTIATDVDGKFKFSNLLKGSTLVFSYIGYQNFELKVTQSQEITVSLKESKNSLDEIVVVGYGSVKKKNLTGSVSLVSSATIENLKPIKVEQALQGTVAGVQVLANSGAPSSKLDIRIRGISSNGENGPLVLVDGYQGNMELLNPSDIESITVLKDAQAAVYGAVGANGVVLVTTKQGKKNSKTKFTFNSYTGFQETTKKIRVLDATEYALLLNESYTNAGLAAPYSSVVGLGEGTNWQDEVFKLAPIINNDLSVSGGSDKITYTFSASKIKQDGIVGLEKSGFDRGTARIAIGADLSEKLTIKTNLIYTDFNRQGLNEGGLGSVLFNAINTPSVFKPYDAVGNFTQVPSTPGYGIEVINPLAQIQNTYNRYNQERLNGSIGLEYKLFDNLKLTSRYGFQRGNSVDKSFNPLINYGDGKVFNNVTQSTVSQNTQKFSNYTFDLFAEYEKRILENHKFKLTIGGTLFEENGEGLFATGYDVPNNSWEFADIALAIGLPKEPVRTNGSYKSTPYKRPSFFGTIDYDYKKKYLLSYIFRRDQSSKFGPNNSVAYFNSVLTGWIISDEDFFNKEGKINFLKLRASYGTLGNDAISGDTFRSLLSGEGVYVFDNSLVSGVALGTITNPDVKWESDTKLDIGFDAKLFNNKIEITADYYNNTRKDLLIRATPVSGINGGSAPGSGNPTVNAGTVKNKGFEFSINYKNNDKKLKYNLGFNIASLNNEVTEVKNSSGYIESGAFSTGQPSPTRMQVGQPIGSFYGYQTDGIFQNQAEVNAHPSQLALGAEAQPGDLRFKDVNGDGLINANDRTFIGKAIPDYTLGFNMTFNYGGFDFVAYSYASIGNDMIRNYERTENKLNKLNYVLDRWTGEGTSTEVPRVTAGASSNNLFSDYFVEDASFFRIQNIQLGYSLPSTFIEKVGFSKVRLYASVNNALTLTKYRGFDPAANSGDPISGGIDYGYYPTPRIYMLGINVNF